MAAAVHTIASVKARQIFDSRGNPTVEVDVTVTGLEGVFRGAVPSGASTGVYEALELRDGDKSVYMGKGVSKAVANVNSIIGPAIIGMDVTQQQKVDDFMVKTLDGSQTENGYTKSKLGANAILGVSMAIARAGAAVAKLPLFAYIATLAGRDAAAANVLPVPFFNVLNAGEHSGAPLVFQEFMIAPVGATSFTQAMRIGTEVYHHLKACVSAKYGASAVGVGDEGGFAPPLATPQEALDLIQMALSKSGHVDTVRIALDVAASEFARTEEHTYDLNKKARRTAPATGATGEADGVLTGEQLLSLYSGLVSHYPIISIEDGFEQDDWTHWRSLTAAMGSTIQIVGDDLLVTNPIRVTKAIETKACNALLLKLNQIGSVSEAIQAVVMAQEAGWGVMTSHRSGETEDAFIADLCVGLSTRQIKSGAAARGERTAKYNQLLRIEEALGDRAVYAGKSFRHATA